MATLKWHRAIYVYIALMHKFYSLDTSVAKISEEERRKWRRRQQQQQEAAAEEEKQAMMHGLKEAAYRAAES